MLHCVFAGVVFMLEYKKRIGENDLVILYSTPEVMDFIRVDPRQTHTNKFGTFRHSDMIDKPYGTKLFGVDGKKFLYLLHPTPELWTRVLPHRTQILYVADISFITLKLGILPGHTVIESGTGSASLSHSLARTLGRSGRLHTFEFHAERAEKARTEFAQHGLENVVIQCRDVCGIEGFGLDNCADAVFLDLPAPWKAIPHAKSAMKKSDTVSRICCFSPCIEQVQKTIGALLENGFVDVELYEVLIRNHECQSINTSSTIDYGLVKQKPANPPEKRIKLDITDRTLASKIVSDVRGHTSYLLFGALLPQVL